MGDNMIQTIKKLYLALLIIGLIVLPKLGCSQVVKVQETNPANNQVVPPTLDKISIKFSSPMKTDSYSIVVAGAGETPNIIGNPVFKDKYTCIIYVKLKPNTLYSLGINSETRKVFVSENGIPAEPFVLTFKTSSQIQQQTQLSKDILQDAENKNIQEPNKVAVKKSSYTKNKTIIYTFYLDQTQGAFWLLIPSGWKVEGGVSEALFQSARFNFSISHHDGWGSIHFIPGARYMPINDFRPPGSVDQYGNVFLPYMEPIIYLRQIVVPNLYPSAQVKELGSKEIPEAAQALKRFYELIGITIPQIKVAELSLETIKGGNVYFDRLIVYVLIYPLMDNIVWETQIIQVSALKEKLAEVEPILMTTLSSFQINPNWVIAKNRAEQIRSEIRMRYQQEILEIQERMYKNRARVNDEISNSIGLELADQAHFWDPKTGEVQNLTSTYDYTWTNGNGTFVQSIDPNFNPNDPIIQKEIGISGDFRIMKRK
jgi:hypothetical protein